MNSAASLDLEKAHLKANRVRSWYWYEQYKSLENNQLNAASQLRNKSKQQKILRQELNERRARRMLSDSHKVSHSESLFGDPNEKCHPKLISASTDDIFGNFCDLHDENELIIDDYSYNDLNTSKNNDDFKSIDNKNVDDTSSDGVNSIVDNIKFENNLETDMKEELENVKQNIANNLNLQLETVKEDLRCLENYAKICDDCKSSDLDSPCECFDEFRNKAQNEETRVNSLLDAWSKLVTFAYQLIQLNHGNCYFDFSSQIWTAVLACDVLRRSITKMCHILQPYTCPVKYATSETDSSQGSIKKRKKSTMYKKLYKTKSTKKLKTNINRNLQLKRKYNSENIKRPHRSRYTSENEYKTKCRGSSEPWRRLELRKSKKMLRYQWSKDSTEKICDKNICKYCLKSAVSPLVKISRYIDEILLDLEE